MAILKSKLLSPHQRLRNLADLGFNPNGRMAVKWGEKGPHIAALQKGLNIMRPKLSYWAYRDWPQLKPDGDFGNRTFAAVKGFQDCMNRADRFWTKDAAREQGYRPGTQAYKKYYYKARNKIKIDGLPGFVTIRTIDDTLQDVRK